VLVPSLWRESLGRVPMEAPANGIPVLACDRGALPGTLGNAGFVFMLPERYMPQSAEIFRVRALARAESRGWEPGRIADQFERLFRSLGGGATAR
jgi:glycosyltransferase involved in cell wall biosynthesis